ncbi:MAG: c-type cytochrome [Saprospiraceae bacterium]|nr:c-type cytochrome [Saprospiraceae bacterium]
MLKWPLLITLIIFSTCKRNTSVVNNFPPMVWPKDNLHDMEKVAIGEKLFFDPILSINKKISCSTCHVPSLAFTDGKKVSNGLFPLSRSAPSLLNIGFHSKGLFWDGGASTLEKQALIPVSSTLEMGLPWVVAEKRINESAVYAKAFKKIYGDIFIDSLKIASVLAQYQRTLLSNNSKFDAVMRGEMNFTPNEKRGWTIFFDADPLLPSAECSHCHVDPLFTDLSFQNNGIHTEDELSGKSTEKGRESVTLNPNDRFKFKVPTLRNIAITAPYMHDGRLKSLEEVMNHYNMGGNPGFNVNPNVRNLNLSKQDIADVIAFLHTLTDLKTEE